MRTDGGSSSASQHLDPQDRLLHAATEIAARDGYANLTVQRVLTTAGVSRATFYQYFRNVDDCFLSAYRQHAGQLLREVDRAVTAHGQGDLAAVQALASFALSHPAPARLLMREGLAAGPAARAERDGLIASVGHSMKRSRRSIDLPADILIGGTFRFLAMQLSEEHLAPELHARLSEWASAFSLDPEGPSFSEALAPIPPEPISQVSLPRIRSGGSTTERILRATCLAILANGYQAMTVQDIVAAAGVSRRRFYDEFRGKADAYIAAYEHGFQQVMGACAPAFFSAGPWRERVWQGGLAFTGFMAREPLLAHLGLIECYAVGPEYTTRVHDTQLAFTLFLEEGYRERPEAEGLSRAQSALATASIFELAFQGGRRGPGFDIRRCQPLAAFIALAPFIGTREAAAFIAGKGSAGKMGNPPDADA